MSSPNLQSRPLSATSSIASCNPRTDCMRQSAQRSEPAFMACVPTEQLALLYRWTFKESVTDNGSRRG